VLHYEVPASVGDQADLIAGKSAELPADVSSVSLHFDHILSAVTFAVDASCTAATVKRISLENVYAAADYGWTSGWSGHSGKSTFSLDLSEAVEEGSAADLTGGGNTMMLLPQTFADDARIVLTLEVDGEEVFNKYARFISDRLSFYDQNDNEVAYISDYKLYITHLHVTESISHGGFVTDTSDGIAIKWEGGDI
jgi:hypothetical protein